MFESNPKLWSKNRRKRKYGNSRKSHPNGSRLQWSQEELTNGLNFCFNDQKYHPLTDTLPTNIENYLSIKEPSKKDIKSNINNIIKNTNPTTIKYDNYASWYKCRHKSNFDVIRGQKNLFIYYQYSLNDTYNAIKQKKKQFKKTLE